jgi:hypothetical protein
MGKQFGFECYPIGDVRNAVGYALMEIRDDERAEEIALRVIHK